MNQERAQWAEEALKAFATGMGANYTLPDEGGEAITDLLCDLMHWSGLNGVNFGHCLALAQAHYEIEITSALTAIWRRELKL